MSQRRKSVYASLSCDIGSTIPKRTTTRDSWVRKSFHCSRPVFFSERSMSEKLAAKPELLPDEGYVKRKTMFFENQPLASSPHNDEEKPKPQETVSKVIKYRVKKQCFGYPYQTPLRRTMTVVGDLSRFDFEFVDASALKDEDKENVKLTSKQRPIARRHTQYSFHPSSGAPGIGDDRGRKASSLAAPNAETKSLQKRVQEAPSSERGLCEIPDPFPLPASSRSDAVVNGRRDVKALDLLLHADHDSSANEQRRLTYDAGAMNGLRQETFSVPRVVAVSVKSYKDIPEELFNTLPESSVDPVPDGEPREEGSNEWTNMLEGRRSLLLPDCNDTDAEADLRHDTQMQQKRQPDSSKASHDSSGPICVDSQPSVGLRLHDNLASKPISNSRSSSARFSSEPEGEVVSPEYLRQLERDLQAAGVFFRFPSPPPPFDEDGAKGEVSVALATLDASLDGFSCSSSDSSSESALPAASWAGRSRPSSVVEAHQFTVETNRGTSVDDGARALPINQPSLLSTNTPKRFVEGPRTIPANATQMHERPENGTPERVPSNGVSRTIIRVRGSASEGVNERKRGREKTGGGTMESLNLIEEVYVSSRTKEVVPESTVQMKAYYPSVDFGQRTSPQPVQIIIDSDSGHESGATSPCGTITGEEMSSPPPSPSIQKQKQQPSNSNDSSTNKLASTTEEPLEVVSDNKETKANDGESSESLPTTAPQMSDDLGMAVVSQTSIEDRRAGLPLEEGSSLHFVVVAIDFGTTYSGYAFSFTRDPDDIHMMKKWEGGDPGIQNQKTPTIVLLTPEEEFHSLGFAARDTFHDLEPKEGQKWLYFDRFKMELHSNQSLTRDTLLEAKNGKKVPALKIFSYALRYFRDHAIRELSEQTGIPVEEEDIRWVITVPAIWSHPAKQFMRTAAYQAGMGSPSKQEKLLIALEPEAAAIYCRRLRQNQLLQGKTDCRNKRLSGTPSHTPTASLRSLKGLSGEASFPIPDMDRDFVSLPFINCEKVADWLCEGTVYMVVDCGGGTVDITVHQMTDRKSGHLKELHKATGGPFGSIGVDQEFEELLSSIFGADFISLFKKQRSAAYVDLMIAFESRKRNASPYKTTPLNIALPFSFIDLYKKTTKKEVENAIRKHAHLGIKWSSQGMLRIEQETMKRLFMPTLEKISDAIRSVLSNPEVGTIQYMFLVGGFSESELLQKHIRDSFGDEVNVIIPQGMGLAILRGAVQFGLDPSVVTVRRSRLTYGVGILNRFEESVHPQEKKVVAAGSEWCADILDKFVSVDESIAIGDVVTRSYTPATPTQKSVILHLYATSEHDVRYVTDPSVQRVGTLHLQLGTPLSMSISKGTLSPNSISPPKEFVDPIDEDGKRREITVHMKFGGTEVKASAVDHFTGQCVKAVIEFLAL